MSDHPRHDRPSAASRAEQMPIVVGFDGSRLAVAATEFAAAEARQCNAPLTLVHGFLWPWFDPPLLPEPGVEVHDPNARVAAVRRLAEATDRVQKQYPDLSVTGRVVDGQAAAVLVDSSRQATLLVVGHRGAGGFAELLAGSVALHTAAHAHCPVVVVRGAPPEPGAPVIVGVDGSPHGRHAVEFAFAVAARRNVPLVAVTVWPPDRPRTHLGRHGRPVETDAVAYLGDCPVRYPQVQVSTETLRATSVGGALVDRAIGAGLVVVGSRGHSTLRGLLLGSVVRALIEHSPCPVAVVRRWLRPTDRPPKASATATRLDVNGDLAPPRPTRVQRQLVQGDCFRDVTVYVDRGAGEHVELSAYFAAAGRPQMSPYRDQVARVGREDGLLQNTDEKPAIAVRAEAELNRLVGSPSGKLREAGHYAPYRLVHALVTGRSPGRYDDVGGMRQSAVPTASGHWQVACAH